MANQRPVIGPVLIESIHSSGKGIAMWNEKKYYIPFTIPHETILAETQNRRMGFRTAIIKSVVESSAFRINAPCKYYEKCGGCNFQHIKYEHQLCLKQSIIQSAFDKYGIQYSIPKVMETKGSIYYRNKVTFEIGYRHGVTVIGFHPEWEKQSVTPVEECMIARNPINDFYKKIKPIILSYLEKENTSALKRFTIRCNQTEDLMLIFELNSPPNEYFFYLSDKINDTGKHCSMYYFISAQNKGHFPEYIHIENTPEYLFENIYGISMRISPQTFFQNNYETTSKILNYIAGQVDFENISVLYDLYSGNGMLSSTLIKNTSTKIIGIEGNSHAIKDARYNAETNLLKNQTHICGDVLETFTENFLAAYPKPDVIILDPPRSGTLIEIQKNILRAKPEFFIYVSCNPVSLAWNLSQLIKEYTIVAVQPFDMFPQTHQVETVVVLKKRSQ